MLHQYLPILVFAALGIIVGFAFATLNLLLGPKRLKNPSTSAGLRQSDPYECGLPSEISSTFRFGVSFYLVAMLFILFDIEVVFLYPVAAILKSADSVFVLAEVVIFVFLLFVAFVYVWRKGALDWK
ncbi:MAG: NADH-quinone oxidoreductase subunit A [Solirubrobacterales bacterium]